ncbi:unnamed protein product [Dibothriocephalus latus]|uniref:Uncharacterized protein n=1 Tax=Dibothriocephalus latus TaxID=60516 RepID=A0A3P6PQ63_DIBLA|nr:unnamed protein product [Dibothriocephalus latus]
MPATHLKNGPFKYFWQQATLTYSSSPHVTPPSPSNNQLVVLCHTKLFGFCLLHLLTVNLCAWLDASLEKVTSSLTGHGVGEENQGWVIFPLTGYLLPSVSEFCAINAAVFFELLQRVGKKSLIHVDKHVSFHFDAAKTQRGPFQPVLTALSKLVLEGEFELVLLYLYIFLPQCH